MHLHIQTYIYRYIYIYVRATNALLEVNGFNATFVDVLLLSLLCQSGELIATRAHTKYRTGNTLRKGVEYLSSNEPTTTVYTDVYNIY